LYVPKYFTLTRSGPIFQLRIPADIARRLSFSRLYVPMNPAPRRILKAQAQAMAYRARQEFEIMRRLTDEDVASLTADDIKNVVNQMTGSITDVAKHLGNPDPIIAEFAETAASNYFAVLLEALRRGREPTPEERSGHGALAMFGRMSRLRPIRSPMDR
jgi:hypothetical protein